MSANFFILAAAVQTEPDLVYIWTQATFETKLVLFALAIMSVFAWSVMASKTVQMRRARKLNRIFQEEYKQQKNVMDIYNRNVEVEGCPLFNIYRETCSEVKARIRLVTIPPGNNPGNVPQAPTPPNPTPITTVPPTVPPGSVVASPIENKVQSTGATVANTAVQPGMQPFPFQFTAASSPVGGQMVPPIQQPITVQRLSMKSSEHIKRGMERLVAEESLKLESNLIMLAIAVSGSPFMGLLGTVWGVMSAFSYVGAKGSADLATMAPGVAGALIATVGGLLVAIPSMFGYNWLVHNLRVFTVEMDNFAQDLASKIETEFLSDD